MPTSVTGISSSRRRRHRTARRAALPGRFAGPGHPLARRVAASVRLRGFTLIEILVVIVIIGVIVTFAVLSFNVLGGDREAEQEARRLAAILAQVRDEAALQGRDLGLRLEPSAYEFMSLEPRRGGWQPVADDDLLRRRELPDGLRMRLWLESREVILEQPRAEKRKKVETPTPQVIVLGSGEIVPFDLEIAREGGGTRWRVAATPEGELVTDSPDASS
jgi:general secretion pathway protein H